MKLDKPGETDVPLPPGLYRAWMTVVEAGDPSEAKAHVKEALESWPRAEKGVFRIGAFPQEEALREAAVETWSVGSSARDQ